MFFRGLRPSSSWGFPFWLLGLTLRSSGPAFCGPLTLAVSLRKTRFIQPHVLFTGVYLLKRLFVGFGVSRRASPFGTAPVLSFFASSAPPPWRSAFSRFALVVNLGLPVLVSGSNRLCCTKPVRLSAELDPKAKRGRPALKTCAAHEKALRHGSGAALQEG